MNPVITLAVCFILFNQSIFGQDTLVLYPDKDAAIQTNIENNSGAGQLFIGKTGPNNGGPFDFYSLIHFDLISLPLNATISSASINMYLGIYNAMVFPNTILIGKLFTDWVEGNGEIVKPAYVPTTQDSGVIYQSGWKDTAFSTMDYDVSNLRQLFGMFLLSDQSQGLIDDIEFWRGDPSANFGWVIYSVDPAQYSLQSLFSREDVEAFRPQLKIFYNCPVNPMFPGNLSNGIFCAQGDLESDGLIQIDTSVVFLMDNSVLLDIGFEVEAGGSLEVK